MNRKRLIIIAVSIIAVIVVVAAIILAVKGSNSKEEYTDTVVTEVVTDENGETVTDENGDAVTVVVTEKVTDKDGETVTDNNGNAVTEKVTTKTTTTAANNNDSGNNSNSSNNSGNNNNNDSDNDDEEEKPKSRKVTVDVVLPYYNKQETEITVSYRVVGDKDYKKLDPVKVKLDKTGKKESFDLGKLKGDVEVVVSFSGITISENSIVISAKDDSGEIKPVTGIEIIEGQDD